MKYNERTWNLCDTGSFWFQVVQKPNITVVKLFYKCVEESVIVEKDDILKAVESIIANVDKRVRERIINFAEYIELERGCYDSKGYKR